jgi:WD40 repeat protein
MNLMLLCRMLLLLLLLLQLWDVETGKERAALSGHTAEIVSVCFNTAGDLLATGSFDHDSRLWDVRSGQCVHVLSGHRGEVSSTVFNHAGAEAHKSAVRVAAAVA